MTLTIHRPFLYYIEENMGSHCSYFIVHNSRNNINTKLYNSFFTEDRKYGQSFLHQRKDPRHTESGKETVSDILDDTGIPRSTFYGWLEAEREATAHDTSYFSAANFHRLRHHAEHMERVISCLKETNCPPSAPLKEKLDEANRLYGKYSVHVLCDALSISRGTFYNHMRRRKGDNAWFVRRREELKPLIQEVYDESEQRFGYDSIAAVLRSRGITVSNKYVRELGREIGLFSIRNDSKLFYEKNNKGHKNRVRRQFNPDAPNQVWVSDVTYYKLKGKHYYICVILDLYSRMVIACKVSKRNSSAASLYKLRRNSLVSGRIGFDISTCARPR